MMFILFYSFCKTGREALDLAMKETIRTNETINNHIVKNFTNSFNQKLTLNRSICNTSDYFSNVDVLDLRQLDFTQLRIVSWILYTLLVKSKAFKSKIRRIVKSREMRREIYSLNNFYMYVNSFIKNLEQDDDEEYPYLLLKSLAFKCYKLIYLLSYIELDTTFSKELIEIMKTKVNIRTKNHCPWKITKIYNKKTYDYLIGKLESVVYKDLK
ncbi:uncharacterized protein VNE69_02261 [Vairimorpha necatrix]|uniref:Uncharacterized protein n=1 Tax=Vairimorpha necatrix TaxID=6039 RepID=A0AAX4J9U8_9MICR